MRRLAGALYACSLIASIAATADEHATTRLEPVTVLDSGEVRDFSVLSGESLRATPPGSSPLKRIESLPGVVWTGSDNLGDYEWGNDLTVRGFGLNQIGFMLDEIPLGSTHYWYQNGIDPNRAVAPENLERIALTPGGGTLESASYNALGAMVRLSTGAPDTQAGVRLKQSIGEYGNLRTYIRGDSGELDSGFKAYLSASGTVADKWKGMGSPGQQPFALFMRDGGGAITGSGGRWGSYHDQLNLKWVQPIGPHQLSLYYGYSDKRENDYADLTFPVYQARGRYFDNYTHWQDALRDVNEDAYFGSAMSYRNDHLAALTGEFHIDSATLKITPYTQADWGYGDWHMPSSDNGTMVDMQYRRSHLESNRSGVNASLSRRWGVHKLAGGLWYEESRFIRKRALYDLLDWQTSPSVDLSAPAATLLHRIYDSYALQAWLKDDITLSEQWLLSLGLKTSRVDTDFADRLGVYPRHSLANRGDVLPQVGSNYRLDENNELFAYYAENVGAIPITVFTTQTFNPEVKPEHSRTVESGWRHAQEGLDSRLSLYYIDYRDRLLQINNCSLLGTCPSLVANVGAVRKWGAEASAQWRFLPDWTMSGTLNVGDSRYLENYVSRGQTVDTAGKTSVDAPQWIAAWELRYQRNGWFAAVKGKYVGERQASYTNDLTAPAFTLWGLVAGYGCQACFGLRELRFQANVENLADKDYIASIGQSGFSASDPLGTNTYVQVGAPRMAFASVEAAF